MGMRRWTLASALRERRRALGLTQEQAGKLMGVKQQSYANWEVGRAPRPSDDSEYAELIQRFSAFLDVRPLEVLRLAYLPDEEADDVDALRAENAALRALLTQERQSRKTGPGAASWRDVLTIERRLSELAADFAALVREAPDAER